MLMPQRQWRTSISSVLDTRKSAGMDCTTVVLRRLGRFSICTCARRSPVLASSFLFIGFVFDSLPLSFLFQLCVFCLDFSLTILALPSSATGCQFNIDSPPLSLIVWRIGTIFVGRIEDGMVV